MAEGKPQEPISGVDRCQVLKMVDNAVTGFCDHFRMLQYWQRLLAGENDPEEIAQGLAMALSPRRYMKNPGPVRGVAITLNIMGNAEPEVVAGAIKSALACSPGQR